MTGNSKDIIEKASSGYLEQTTLRAAVQAIPFVGGSLDTLISGKGAKIQRERLEIFLAEFSNRLETVRSKGSE